MSLDVQYIDGTKIESVANKYTFVWKGSVEKYKTNLETKVKAVLKNAEHILQMEEREEVAELSSEEMSIRADNILDKMDREGISNKEIRKSVEKVKRKQAPKMQEYKKNLETLGERNSYSKDRSRCHLYADEGGCHEQRTDQARIQYTSGH